MVAFRVVAASVALLSLIGCQTTSGTSYRSGGELMPTAGGFMPTGQQVVPPLGYLIFCKQAPHECAVPDETDNSAEPVRNLTIEMARPAAAPSPALVVMTAAEVSQEFFLPLARPDRAPLVQLTAVTEKVPATVQPSLAVAITSHAANEVPRRATAEAPFKLTADRWQELASVNTQVNNQVRAVTDDVLYQRSEWWSYPTNNAGDCEDYVLLKRKLLVAKGWPASNLLITVAKLWNGEGHAVLVAVTDKGEFVLDNMERDIMSWQEAPYQWVSRQSQEDPKRWVNLDPSRMIRNAQAEHLVVLENDDLQS
eukprot:s1_g813.t1